MNSELLKKLVEISKDNKKRINELKGEYAELTDIERKQTSKDLRRIKEIRSELVRLNSLNNELDEDLKYVKGVTNKLKNFKKGLDEQPDPLKKELLEEKVEELETELKSFAEGLEEKYSALVKDYDENKERQENSNKDKEDNEESKDEKKKPKKSKKAIAALAILAALGVGTTGYALGKGIINPNFAKTSMSDAKLANQNEKAADKPVDNNSTSSTSSSSEITRQEVVERMTFEEEQKSNLEFTDINDEEQVEKRAYEVIQYLDENIEGHDYTVDEVCNIIKWVNGGNVETPTFDDALFAISRIEDIMNKENQEEVKNTFDVSKLYIDGSKGQKLAGQIYESKKELKETKGTEEFQTKADKFAELIINSWLLNGTNNVQSAFSLEKGGMKTFVDVYFLNTYAYIDVPVNVSVTVADRTTEYNLDDVAVLLNQPAFCDENGTIDETVMDKFSSDLNDMVEEAVAVKENTNSGLTLK